METHQRFEAPIEEGPTEAFSPADLEKIEGMHAEGQAEERPEWLPEKFQNAEALATAYHELEQKLGTAGQEAPAGAAPAVEGAAFEENFWQEAASAYSETGGITDAQLKTLTAAGVPQEMVDTYMAGLGALQAQQEYEAYDMVGGKESYTEMMEWAAKTLPPEEQAAHNNAVDGGSLDTAKMAIRGLWAQYQNSTSGGPKLVTTGKAPQFGGVEPFGDSSQVTAAINDPRYRTSPAYRQEVERRLAASDVFGG